MLEFQQAVDTGLRRAAAERGLSAELTVSAVPEPQAHGHVTVSLAVAAELQVCSVSRELFASRVVCCFYIIGPSSLPFTCHRVYLFVLRSVRQCHVKVHAMIIGQYHNLWKLSGMAWSSDRLTI